MPFSGTRTEWGQLLKCTSVNCAVTKKNASMIRFMHSCLSLIFSDCDLECMISKEERITSISFHGFEFDACDFFGNSYSSTSMVCVLCNHQTTECARCAGHECGMDTQRVSLSSIALAKRKTRSQRQSQSVRNVCAALAQRRNLKHCGLKNKC